MGPAIAIVGMACRYPDARSPDELWENALAQRRAFRRIPAERLNLNDYLSSDRQSPDQTYSTEGAFIEGYEFDRARFRVPGATYRAADPAHWLTLDVAAAALEDAGFPEGEGLPREATGVFVGNTLTGEFSRANTMRLRWPYVRRVVRKVLEESACPAMEFDQQHELLAAMETLYKKPFPEVGAETLAGGLSNTIAGRICNHFDLKGGGYTVDGACASSLLAVINACTSLAMGDLEVAIAGGVDLSTDPFELVGFAKTGALAADMMRVYDTRSAGFWPGEGCGLIVLMRHEDALLRGLRVYAVIRGWGVSSDGSGGITRPEVEGQLIALRRAYARAGYGADTVAYFEGHGTGTAVGDATELQALARARHEATEDVSPAVVSSVKAIIGHTKAAAGVAGLIKATKALDAQILPPTVGCDDPHEELKRDGSALRALKQAELFSSDTSLRAGVSAMGFGGINTHVTLEAIHDDRRQSLTSRERALLTSAQDAELFLFSARDTDQLENQIERVLAYADRLSRSELTDLAVRLSETVRSLPVRGAVVASSAAELSARLEALKLHLRSGVPRLIDQNVFLSTDQSSARIGFLFPGQGSPSYKDGGAWRRRFNYLEDLYTYTKQNWHGDGVSTDVAQPAIVASSVAALRVLSRLGITGAVGVGHSLGEFTAFHWAGLLDESSLLRIARARGRAMAAVDGPTGAMLSVAADRRAVEEILNGEKVVIAGLNSPTQTVLSGETLEISRLNRRAEAHGLRTTLLRVSHAFHSSLVAPAGIHLYAHLEREEFAPLQRQVFSTVTGQHLNGGTDFRALLRDQVTSPVRFMEAVDAAAASSVDLWIEVGPGQTLCGLVGQFRNEPAVALDAGGNSIRGLLNAVGACFCLGARVAHDELFADRFARPFDLDWRPRFFANPCELAPPDLLQTVWATHPPATAGGTDRVQVTGAPMEQATHRRLEQPTATPLEQATDSALEVVRRLVAERLELPITTIENGSRLLDDLHLNSISVAQLVAEAARHLNLPPPPAPTHYANATLSEMASALEAAARAGSADDDSDAGAQPAGVDEWVREFSVEFVERALPGRDGPTESADWRIFASPDHPLKDPVERAFAHASAGRGIVVLLPSEPDETHIDLLLDAAREALKGGDDFHFVLVGGAASFARTLHLEAKNLNTCVVDVPLDHPNAAAWILAEGLAARGYAEARYTSDGKCWEPVLRPLEPEPDNGELPLTTTDVLVVTGGARGITAECALRLARESGSRLAILGLSQPAADDEIVTNLERMKAAGINFRYYSVDVTDAAATREAIREVERDLGPVTAILHGAARNVPCLIENLKAEAICDTLAPKIRGAQNLLAAINPDHLRLFITFSSIIARTGLPGEAHYGLANEWLTRLTERWQTTHPHCRGLAIEWSVWSGVGMGARLGTVDELARRGITPIPIEKGLDALRKLLSRKSTNAVVMGRLRDMPTLKVERPELPFLRFLEKPLVYYPKIELVVDAELSTATDPYLDDHVFRGERLLPAVMGMEAMAQVFMALTETNEPPVFEQVGFERPVVIREGAVHRIRVAALVRTAGSVEILLRSSETGFQVDHFRAVCRAASAPVDQPLRTFDPKTIGLDPQHDLYGRILFHTGRFQRLREYRVLKATECAAEIVPDGTTTWFGRYLPGSLVLGDPGARDAAIHAVQACVPQITLLPVRVEKITGSLNGEVKDLVVHAHERERLANGFVYDVELTDTAGNVRERWERLQLHAISGTDFKGPWPEGLLTPYIERCLPELIPGANVSVAFERNDALDRRDRSTRAIESLLGAGCVIRRINGKPEACDGRHVSASHCGDLTMAVAGPAPVGCDLELVTTRTPAIWSNILGAETFTLAEVISREAQETLDVAATRVWTALECLKKAGAGMTAPLVFTKAASNGWIVLTSGELKIASVVVQREGAREDLAIALLTGGEDARV